MEYASQVYKKALGCSHDSRSMTCSNTRLRYVMDYQTLPGMSSIKRYEALGPANSSALGLPLSFHLSRRRAKTRLM